MGALGGLYDFYATTANTATNIYTPWTSGTITSDHYVMGVGHIAAALAPASTKPHQDWLDKRIDEMRVKL